MLHHKPMNRPILWNVIEFTIRYRDQSTLRAHLKLHSVGKTHPDAVQFPIQFYLSTKRINNVLMRLTEFATSVCSEKLKPRFRRGKRKKLLIMY